jgi:hypothetical protein
MSGESGGNDTGEGLLDSVKDPRRDAPPVQCICYRETAVAVAEWRDPEVGRQEVSLEERSLRVARNAPGGHNM